MRLLSMVKYLKSKLLIVSLCLGVLLGNNFVFANDILTSSPVTYALSTSLAKHTPITTAYLPPKRYSMDRLPNWFRTKGAATISNASANATAVVTLGSVWPQDPTFVYARDTNIRVVEIDAAQSISARAEGVAVLKKNNSEVSRYVWLNPNNLTTMASIVAKDFKKLWPEHSQIIDKNLQALRVTFLEVVRDQQTFVLDNDIDTVVLLSPTLEDFASGNQLFVDETIYEPELEWSDEQKRSIQEKFTDDDSLWLLTDKKPSTTLTSMVPKARILVVDPLTRWGSQGIDSDFPFERWTISALDNTSK